MATDFDSHCRHAATARSSLQWPRSMQAVDFVRQRWNVIGSWRPVGKTSADTPQPMYETVADGISSGSLHVCQQDNHLPAQQHAQLCKIYLDTEVIGYKLNLA